MLQKSLFLILIIAFVIIKNSNAQSNLYHLTAKDTTKYKPGELAVTFESNQFFVNNEYSRPLTKGYTLPGQYFRPNIKYLSKNNAISLEIGLKIKHFFGQKYPLSCSPKFAFDAKILPNTNFIIGSIKSGLSHQMSDILLANEGHYTAKSENGVQLRHNSKKAFFDLWVNWEDYIRHGDTIPEMFTTGLSFKAPIISKNGWELSTPIQTTIVHVGGEISTFSQSGRSDMNNLFGIELKKENYTKSKSIGVFSHFLHYRELKEKRNNAYKQGNGLHSGIFGSMGNHNVNVTYWQAHQFLSLRGSQLYQSQSDYNSSLLFPDRKMITAAYLYKLELAENFYFSLLCNGYYDFAFKNLDYSYGIQLLFVPHQFIKKVY